MSIGSEEIATIVVCEDDPPTLDLLCDHLVADRFEALPVSGAADALRVCRYNRPALMLLDLSLANGLDVLREIREGDGAEPHAAFAEEPAAGELLAEFGGEMVVVIHFAVMV